jgi:hypothetical protein
MPFLWRPRWSGPADRHFAFAFSPEINQPAALFRCLSNLVFQAVRLVIAAELAWRSLVELKQDAILVAVTSVETWFAHAVFLVAPLIGADCP